MKKQQTQIPNNKPGHPQLHNVKFVCASCNSSYEILSVLTDEVRNIDVCSKCHPVYIGDTSKTKVRGRAEKIAHRFVRPDDVPADSQTKVDKKLMKAQKKAERKAEKLAKKNKKISKKELADL